MSATTQDTCSAKLPNAVNGRMADLKAMYRPHDCDQDELIEFLDGMGIDTPDPDEDGSYDENEEILNENASEEKYNYGLAFDYVTPGTFDNDAGFWRYQISCGGPSEELRFYTRDRVDFVYLDWFDGATFRLSGDQLETASVMFDDFDDCGTTDHVREQAEGS